MLSHSHYNEGTELALLLISIFNESQTKVSKESLDVILNIFSLYDEGNAGKETFMKAAIKWTATEGQNKQGEPQLHLVLAETFWKEKDFGKAAKHFLRSDNPERFSEMLAEWSSVVYLSERDLVIARAVLQYLSLSNLKDANIVYQKFLKLSPNFPQTPLINYIRFLLMTLERDAYPLYQILRKKYEPSLARDPTFDQNLDVIAQVFYNVRPSQPGGLGNMFGDIMRSLLTPEQQNQ